MHCNLIVLLFSKTKQRKGQLILFLLSIYYKKYCILRKTHPNRLSNAMTNSIIMRCQKESEENVLT